MTEHLWDREDVTFSSGETECAAWPYTPDRKDPTGRGPIVVMAHSLGGVRQQHLDAFAERFEAAGYACLVFDYRYFGDSGGEPRQLLDISSQRADWTAAIAFARSLPSVDPARVVVWGSSFGGGHALVIAAQDKRLAAAIAQCPFTDGLTSARTVGEIPPLKLSALAVRDALGARPVRAPVIMASYGPPGSTALMNAPDAVAGMQAMTPPGQTYPKDVAARTALQIATPGRYAKRIDCPSSWPSVSTTQSHPQDKRRDTPRRHRVSKLRPTKQAISTSMSANGSTWSSLTSSTSHSATFPSGNGAPRKDHRLSCSRSAHAPLRCVQARLRARVQRRWVELPTRPMVQNPSFELRAGQDEQMNFVSRIADFLRKGFKPSDAPPDYQGVMRSSGTPLSSFAAPSPTPSPNESPFVAEDR